MSNSPVIESNETGPPSTPNSASDPSNCPVLAKIGSEYKAAVDMEQFTIGRGLLNNFVIEDLRISRCHCIIEKVLDKWYIKDTSTNGTNLNRLKLPPQELEPLSGGEIISLCDDQQFVFELPKQRRKSKTMVPGDDDNPNADIVQDVTPQLNENDSTSVTQPIASCNEIQAQSSEDVTTLHDADSILKDKNEPSCSETSLDLTKTTEKKVMTETMEDVENELMCVICTELFVKATTTNCSHTFCNSCLSAWRKKNNKCPICRASIKTANATIVLDNFIGKIMESASAETKRKREELLQTRNTSDSPKPNSKKKKSTTASESARTSGINPIIVSSDESATDDYDSIEELGEEEEDEDDFVDEPYNGLYGVYYGGYGRCYSCGERGHWANGCPYR